MSSGSTQAGSIDHSRGSRTILWCVPRAISSAFAKCISFVEGSEVWFERYTTCHITRIEYEAGTRLTLPMEYEGNEDIFQKAKDMLEKKLLSKINADRLPYGSVKHGLEASTAKHVFVKDMAAAMTEGFRQYLPDGYRHTFLIRHPIRFLLSYRKAVFRQLSDAKLLEGEALHEENFDIERHDPYIPKGIYVKELYDLWKYLKDENIDPNPIIIDGDDLLTKPAETLSAYCAEVGLPYNDSLLQWDGSVDAFNKMKASGDNVLVDLVNFFEKAMKSSCFLPPSKFPLRDQLTADVIRCSDKVMPYFDELYQARLKV